MTKKFPADPAHPERNCWGCDRYCRATEMRCGNGSVRTPHPSELFGDDSWLVQDSCDEAASGKVPGHTPDIDSGCRNS